MVGGLVARDPEGIAARLPGAKPGAVPGCASWTVRGPVGLFSSLGEGHPVPGDQVWTVGDLDLTNLAELGTLTGCDPDSDRLIAEAWWT